MATLKELVQNDPEAFQLWLNHPFTQAYIESLDILLEARAKLVLYQSATTDVEVRSMFNLKEQWKGINLARQNIVDIVEALRRDGELLQEIPKEEEADYTSTD